MVLAAHPRPMSSACLLSVENFSQRIIREVRNAETKEDSQRRLSNIHIRSDQISRSVVSASFATP